MAPKAPAPPAKPRKPAARRKPSGEASGPLKEAVGIAIDMALSGLSVPMIAKRVKREPPTVRAWLADPKNIEEMERRKAERIACSAVAEAANMIAAQRIGAIANHALELEMQNALLTENPFERKVHLDNAKVCAEIALKISQARATMPLANALSGTRDFVAELASRDPAAAALVRARFAADAARTELPEGMTEIEDEP